MKTRAAKFYRELFPRYIRCYDNNGETFDRYTVVFTNKRIGGTKQRSGEFVYAGMSEYPYHPQGFYQHGFFDTFIDKPSYSHLGKKIKFYELPDDCQKAIIEEYNMLWDISQKDYDYHLFRVLGDFVNTELIPLHPDMKRFLPQFDKLLKFIENGKVSPHEHE